MAAATQKLDALYQGVTFHSPPSEVIGHATGKKIWVIDISLAAAEGELVAQAAQAAGKVLGWQVTVYDGQYTPSRYLQGVEDAIAAKANGIFLYAVDCAGIQTALQQAKDAGIMVAAAESSDCDTNGGSQLFNGTVSYTQGDFQTWAASAGSADADWIIATTKGAAKVVSFDETDDNSTIAINSGFVKELATCSTCKIVDSVPFTGADLGPGLQEKAEQALLQHPDANVVMAPYDGVMTQGIAAAVQSSGRLNQLQVVAGGGTAAALDVVRAHDGETAGYLTSLTWEGWAGMDVLNRLFLGQPVVPSGIGMEVFDRTHNLPPSGGWQPSINFVGAYEKDWKV